MKKFAKLIAFTKTPLKGFYRFEDYFQVYPLVSKNSPKSIVADHFPCCIELFIKDEEVKHFSPFDSTSLNRSISWGTTQSNKLIEITNLLSSITNYRFFHYKNIELNWAIQIPDETTKETDSLRSMWTLRSYYYPESAEDLIIENFTETNFKNIPLFDKNLYYYYEPLESRDKLINFPLDIDARIKAYLNLNNEQKAICDSAMFMFCNGLDIYHNMKSLSFISMVSSIETLVNYEFRDEKVTYECNNCKSLKSSPRACSKCGMPTWGIGAKFREFLFKFVSDEDAARKMYNKIYDIRSKIIHTEYLIGEENYLSWDFEDKTHEIVTKHRELMQIARRAVSNWMLSK